MAMTRARDTNSAYLYERRAGETEHEHNQPGGLHILRRGTSRGAAQLVRVIIANHDEQAHTAHDITAETQGRGQLPDRAARLLDPALMLYGVGDTPTGTWWTRSRIRSPSGSWIDQHVHRSQDQGLDYDIDL